MPVTPVNINRLHKPHIERGAEGSAAVIDLPTRGAGAPGPQGEEGPPGDTGPPGEAGAQGLPGVNAVENDAAVAAYLADAGSDTGALAAAMFAPKPDNAARAVGQGELMFNVRDDAFGAVGDGATPDGVAINAAITAANTAGGGVVLIPYAPNGYAVTGTITLKTGVTLRGQGHVALKKTASGTQMFVTASGATDVTVEDLTVDANDLITSRIFRIDTNSARVTVRNCILRDPDKNATLGAIETRTGSTDILIENNWIDGAYMGIHLAQGPKRVTVRRNRITDWGLRAVYVVGTSTLATEDLTIEHNLITDVDSTAIDPRCPIQFTHDDALFHKRVKVNHNTVIGNGTSHASGTGTADQINVGGVEEFEVIGNISMLGGDNGITVARGARRGVVAHNVSTSNWVAGLCLGWPVFDTVTNVAVTGNTFMNNGQVAGSAGHAGLRVRKCSHVSVSGNVLADDKGTHTQQYGLQVDESSNVNIGMNTFFGNVQGAISYNFAVANTNVGVGFLGTTPVALPAANADTSGATLLQLETEVNQLKALLRSIGLLTP